MGMSKRDREFEETWWTPDVVIQPIWSYCRTGIIIISIVIFVITSLLLIWDDGLTIRIGIFLLVALISLALIVRRTMNRLHPRFFPAPNRSIPIPLPEARGMLSSVLDNLGIEHRWLLVKDYLDKGANESFKRDLVDCPLETKVANTSYVWDLRGGEELVLASVAGENGGESKIVVWPFWDEHRQLLVQLMKAIDDSVG